MKVLHVTPYMDSTTGGPPVVVAELTRQELARGWGSAVLTSLVGCRGCASSLQRFYGDGFPLEVLAVRNALGLWMPAVKDSVSSHISGSDIVVIHTLWHALGVRARQACTEQRKPYLLMPHGMLDPYSIGVKGLKKRLYLRVFEGRNLHGAQRILFTTEEEARLAAKSLPGLPPAVIVPLGAEVPADLDREQVQSKFLEIFPFAQSRRCLLFLSRIHPKKGLERLLPVLVEVRRSCPEVLLLIAGGGGSAYIEYLKRHVGQLDLNQHVLFTGMLQGALKWGAFAVAEAFVLPSHQENFAIVVAEAMHMGLPVILTDKVNTWPYVEKAQAGFVISDDDFAGSLRQAILTILASPEDAREMGMRGRNLARREMTWQRAGDIMAACYHDVLSSY